MAIGTRKNQLKNACAWPPQKSHHNLEMLLKECPFVFVDRIKQANSLSLKNVRNKAEIYKDMWGAFPGTFAKKCLFNSWMLIGFSEHVSLKNGDWFLKTTLEPTTCFFKECQKCFLLKNANARRACDTKKWPLPSFWSWNLEGDSFYGNSCKETLGIPCKATTFHECMNQSRLLTLHPGRLTNRTWTWWFGRCLSFSRGVFSGAPC